MIEWIIGFLIASWWSKREEEKKRKTQEQKENINYQKISFGYIRDDESIKDLT